MRKLIIALLVTSIVLPSVNGQTAPTRGRYVPARPTPAPSQGAPRKRSLFDILFGPLPTPTPIPRPSPTPAPIVKRRPRPKAKPVASTVKRTESESPTTEPATQPKAAVKTEPKTTATKVPSKAPAKTSKGSASTQRSDLSGMDDSAKFKAVKTQAAEDPAIQQLKAKADGELDEAEAQKALQNYNRALFRKIREIEPSLGDYTDRVEQSMTKRIGAEAAKP